MNVYLNVSMKSSSATSTLLVPQGQFTNLNQSDLMSSLTFFQSEVHVWWEEVISIDVLDHFNTVYKQE